VKVSSFFAKIKEPVLANPTLKFTGDIRATKLYPSPLPDLFKGGQLVLAGRYSGKGDSAVIVEGTVNGEARKFTYEVKFPEASTAPGAAPNASVAVAERVAQYTQQQQFVAGKNFFQNDKQWIDSALQKQPNAKRARIQFASPEYFDLAAKNAKALPWLALGQN